MLEKHTMRSQRGKFAGFVFEHKLIVHTMRTSALRVEHSCFPFSTPLQELFFQNHVCTYEPWAAFPISDSMNN